MFEMELVHVYEQQRRIERDMKETNQGRGARWTLRSVIAAFWAPCPASEAVDSSN